jgi:hypothetical protein
MFSERLNLDFVIKTIFKNVPCCDLRMIRG